MEQPLRLRYAPPCACKQQGVIVTPEHAELRVALLDRLCELDAAWQAWDGLGNQLAQPDDALGTAGMQKCVSELGEHEGELRGHGEGRGGKREHLLKRRHLKEGGWGGGVWGGGGWGRGG